MFEYLSCTEIFPEAGEGERLFEEFQRFESAIEEFEKSEEWQAAPEAPGLCIELANISRRTEREGQIT